MMQSLWRRVGKFLKKLKIELSCDPEIPFLGIYLEKTIIQKHTHTPMFIQPRYEGNLSMHQQMNG